MALFAAALIWAVWIFNRLVRLRSRVRAAWSDIDVQLTRTGPPGAVGRDLVARIVAPDEIRFATTRRLGVGEGLTIVAGFPKGVVAEPMDAQLLLWLPHANTGTLALGIGFSVLYGGLAWLVAGGDGLPAMLVAFGLAVAANALFAWLLKVQTQEGLSLLDQVEGLKLYLSVAERDELKSLPGSCDDVPPRLDAERLAAFLPFALALDVEEVWTRKFTLAAGAAAAALAAGGMQWNSARGGSSDLTRMSRSLGKTLSSQIATSATPLGRRRSRRLVRRRWRAWALRRRNGCARMDVTEWR